MDNVFFSTCLDNKLDIFWYSFNLVVVVVEVVVVIVSSCVVVNMVVVVGGVVDWSWYQQVLWSLPRFLVVIGVVVVAAGVMVITVVGVHSVRFDSYSSDIFIKI